MPVTYFSTQEAAVSQAQRVEQMIRQYQSTLPLVSGSDGQPGNCRADAWQLSHEELNGDFAVDEPLARTLATRVRPSLPNGGLKHWLSHYLFDGPDPGAGVDEYARHSAIGPGNMLGNASGLKDAANAAVARNAAQAIKAGLQQIKSGVANHVKINAFMTLYNANKSGKGLPRPRMRITGLRLQVVSPAFGEEAIRVARSGNGMTASMRRVAMAQTESLGRLAAGSHWTGRFSFLSGKVGGGVLTFGPSAAIDLYNSVDRDMKGNVHWNSHRFLVDSAKSQSGNLLGWAAGGLVIVAAGTMTAPVLLVSLGVGVIVQAIWNSSGMADRMGEAANSVFGK